MLQRSSFSPRVLAVGLGRKDHLVVTLLIYVTMFSTVTVALRRWSVVSKAGKTGFTVLFNNHIEYNFTLTL